MKYLVKSFCVIASVIFTGCGGGGGDDKGINNSSAVVSSSSQAVSEDSFLNRQNTPKMVSNYMDLVMFAKDTSVSIVNGDFYFDLPDGTYKENCSNSKGSLELVVSAGGNNLKQKYINCTLLVPNELGGTDTVSLSGQEDVLVVRNSDRPSTFQVTWNNYSIESNNSPKVELDGVFTYVGMLGYSTNINYINITSAITINVTLKSEGEVITARNLEFIFDFPAIFDRYSNDFPFSHPQPNYLHLFTAKIMSASGEIIYNNNRMKSVFDPQTKVVTFSANNNAKAYLKRHEQGFYCQLDENNDNKIDFNTFLSTKEYISLSENVNNQSLPIYVTRFPELYGEPLPKELLAEDRYVLLDLSRTAKLSIDIQHIFTSRSGALLEYKIDDSLTSKDWVQIESGIFEFTFPDSDGAGTYELALTAHDLHGNRSSPVRIQIRMNDNLADTDFDGILDIHDSDIDNDGVENQFDSFPKNPAETSDIDRDQIGDNSDPDIDNDGVGNDMDVYPKESSCHTADRGDQIGCYLTNASYGFNDGRIIYFIQSVKSENERDAIRFIKFDTQDLKFLDPSPELDLSRSISALVYDSVHNKVLINDLVDVSWKNFILNLDDYSMKAMPETPGMSLGAMFSEFGFFVMSANPADSDYEWSEVYDHNGVLIGSNEEYVKTNKVEYSNANTVKNDAKVFCDFSISITAQGEFSVTGDYERRYDDKCNQEMEISPDGNYMLTDLFLRTPFYVFNKQREEVFKSEGWYSVWIESSVLYINYNLGFTESELVVVDFINNTTHRLPLPTSLSWYVIGDRVVTFSTGGGYYNNPAILNVYDSKLDLLFSYAKTLE
jgi:Thrombospondin type 3 repeat